MARYRDMNVSQQAGLVAFSGFSIETWGDKGQYHTRITVNSAFPDIAGGANLAVGLKMMDFPAGEIFVERSSMSIALQHTDTAVAADTPDLGIGTTIGSGVQALLSGVGAAAENIITGQTAADVNGAVTTVSVDTPLVIPTANSHSVYLNLADGWAATGDDGILVSGTVDIFWQRVGG